MRFPPGPILREIAELDEPQVRAEEVVHVAGARVVFADYEVLRHDFPALRAESPEEIDGWLIAHAAFVSTAQAAQAAVNTPIAVEDRRITAWRPPQYGRAVVVSLPDHGGLLDLKGAGVAPGMIPSHAEHSNGLEYLGVALGDLVLKSVIDEIFARTGPSLWTVPVYAILDLGFDLKDGWRGTAPAGLHVRRAHRRAPGGTTVPASGSIEERVKLEMEMRLRSYGMTSTTRGGSLEVELEDGALKVLSSRQPVPPLEPRDEELLRRLLGVRSSIRFERVNIQLARDVEASPPGGQMFDFGHINLRTAFIHPVSSAVSDRPLCLGGILWPDDPTFIQPDPALALAPAIWDREVLSALLFPLAIDFRAGRVTRDQIRRKLSDEPMQRLLEGWSSAG